MRARTRLVLDITLLAAFAVAFRPNWTGISLHQWLSIAIVAPVLVHVVVNWEWAVRVLKTFVERLLSASRLNFVVDCVLFLAAVAVIVSGFMVSPALIGPLGVHVGQPYAWHLVHLWSANATIALLVLHFALHWNWIVSTATSLAEKSQAAPQASRPVRAAGVVSAATHSVRRSHVGRRRRQAARERATVLSTASAVALSAVLGLAVFVGVSWAAPAIAPHSAAGRISASASELACPKTGCTASTCHGTANAAPAAFYNKTQAGAAEYRAFMSRATGAGAAKVARAGSAVGQGGRPGGVKVAMASVPAVVRTAPRAMIPGVSAVKPKAATSGASRPVAASTTVHKAASRRMFTCPVSGCTRSSCHGSAGVSPGVYYRTH